MIVYFKGTLFTLMRISVFIFYVYPMDNNNIFLDSECSGEWVFFFPFSGRKLLKHVPRRHLNHNAYDHTMPSDTQIDLMSGKKKKKCQNSVFGTDVRCRKNCYKHYSKCVYRPLILYDDYSYFSMKTLFLFIFTLTRRRIYIT